MIQCLKYDFFQIGLNDNIVCILYDLKSTKEAVWANKRVH